MLLSIVIVNYNVKYLLEQCLRSVREAAQGIEVETWVVDNASTDGSVDYLRPLFPEVHFIENADNPGFAKANNQAIRLSRGRYVLLLNPDTIVTGEALRGACHFMDSHTNAGAIGVKMINGHGAFLPESKRSFPTPWVAFCKLSGLSRLFPRSPRLAAYGLRYLSDDAVHEVQVLSGAFMFLRHEALRRIGLLDEAFFMYGEDIDLSYRMIPAGYANYYLPFSILHYKGESTHYADRRYLNAFYNAMLIFYRKHYPNAGGLAWALIRLAVCLRKALAGLFGWKRTHPSRRRGGRRPELMYVCSKAHAADVRRRVLARFPEAVSIAWEAADEIGAIPPQDGYTDIIFCHPDLSFDRMIHLMDRCPDKRMTYHTFYPDTDRWISPTR